MSEAANRMTGKKLIFMKKCQKLMLFSFSCQKSFNLVAVTCNISNMLMKGKPNSIFNIQIEMNYFLSH